MKKLKTQREFIIELLKDGDLCMDAYVCPNCKDLLFVIVEGQKYECRNPDCFYDPFLINENMEIVG